MSLDFGPVPELSFRRMRTYFTVMGASANLTSAFPPAPSGQPLFFVDHDLIQWPAERESTLAEGVLTLGALGVLKNLTQGALTHVQVGLPLEVGRRDLVVHDEVHVVAHLL